MTDLGTLATHLEQAGPESQAELLRMAWAAIMPSMAEPYIRFQAMLNCGAYLSAAEMLIPDGWPEGKFLWSNGYHTAVISRSHPINGQCYGQISSARSLAFAAACVRAAIARKES